MTCAAMLPPFCKLCSKAGGMLGIVAVPDGSGVAGAAPAVLTGTDPAGGVVGVCIFRPAGSPTALLMSSVSQDPGCVRSDPKPPDLIECNTQYSGHLALHKGTEKRNQYRLRAIASTSVAASDVGDRVISGCCARMASRKRGSRRTIPARPGVRFRKP